MNPHIVLVEPDSLVRHDLSRCLGLNGMRVTALENARALFAELARETPSLIVLRDGLPDSTSAAVLQSLRHAPHTATDTPVIMIGASNGSIDAIICLELGADDYLKMPCNERELLTRVRNVLRRVPQPTPSLLDRTGMLRLGRFMLDFNARRLECDGEPVPLHPSLFALLEQFARHPLAVLSRGSLADKLGDLLAGRCARSLDVLVCRLRQILEDDPARPRYIQTVRGRGYVFSPHGEVAASPATGVQLAAESVCV